MIVLFPSVFPNCPISSVSEGNRFGLEKADFST